MGLTLLANNRHHLDVFLSTRNGRRVVMLRARVCELAPVQAEVAVNAGPVVLAVEIQPDQFVFTARTGGRTHPLGALSSKLVSSEVAGGFTGVMTGLFAVSANDRLTAFFRLIEDSAAAPTTPLA